jgi:hypothetical protein
MIAIGTPICKVNESHYENNIIKITYGVAIINTKNWALRLNKDIELQEILGAKIPGSHTLHFFDKILSLHG